MSQLTHHLAAKITAIFLFVFSIIGFVCGTVGTVFLAEYNFYETSGEAAKKEIFENITRGYANQVFYDYWPAYKNNSYDFKEQQEAFSSKHTNFLFVLKNENGDRLLSNYSNQEYEFSRSYQYQEETFTYDEAKDATVNVKSEPYTIDCYVNKTLSANDRYVTAEYWINFAYSMRYTVIALALISLIASIILFVFLMCSAGHRKGEDKVIPNGIDKIPFDIFMAVLFTIACIEFVILNEFHNMQPAAIVLFLAIFVILDTLLALLAFMSFATRYKLGRWWKNTVLYRILRFIFRAIRSVFRGIKYLFQHLSLMWMTILVLLALSFVEFVAIASYESVSTLLSLWMLEKLILVPTILLIIISLVKLQIGGQKFAEGDLNYHINTSYMFWNFKRHGENLNSISGGMSKAVDERMKSERFKTELITNVSHDIKTPLTSIINYVDLIKKEEIGNETLKEYVKVLDRQSSRLKKLIEDLVEASKASTGNMTVNMARTEVNVLLTQTVGEYEERTKNSGLELILKQPEDEVFIMSDGRLLWRVFDNLMSNICKYAQPGTRAYLDLEQTNGQAVITFRNVSKYALNITSDELLERFVRGDSSRNTEGSGLGLSIARSLVELQKGKLDLYIDGDLFKVVLKFSTVR